jgi:hypothetical protein
MSQTGPTDSRHSWTERRARDEKLARDAQVWPLLLAGAPRETIAETTGLTVSGAVFGKAVSSTMMLLLPGNAKSVMDHINNDTRNYGWLLTPRRSMSKTGLYGMKYAVDNECFTLADKFDAERYLRALGNIVRTSGVNDCLFATAPDVVGDARATLRRSSDWLQQIRALGLPAALVAQDGIEDFEIPWSEFDALFIGGTTQFKLSSSVADLIKQAKKMGKWTHMGRVNSVYRASRIIEFPDSVDGTAWAKHPAKYCLQWQRWLDIGKPRQARLI